jgi:hypothetical protein
MVLDHFFVAISDAAKADMRRRPAMMGDAHLSGRSVLTEPENHLPFGDALMFFGHRPSGRWRSSHSRIATATDDAHPDCPW